MNAPKTSSRRGVLAAAGIAGLAGGLGWAWHRHGEPQAQQAGEALPGDFWSHTFDTAAGASLSLASLKGQRLLLNFWATWCPPCVKEMPELDRFHSTYQAQGWRVLGLAIDGPTPVRDFLKTTPVSFPILLAGFGGTELSRSLGNSAGGLPFSVLVDAEGRLRQRKMGATDFHHLSQWAREIG